jgi:hypothetical protein
MLGTLIMFADMLEVTKCKPYSLSEWECHSLYFGDDLDFCDDDVYNEPLMFPIYDLD